MPCPAPSHGVKEGGCSGPAPPSLGSWRQPPHCSVGAGPGAEANWQRRGERKGLKLGGRLKGWLGVSFEVGGPRPLMPVRWGWWVADCAWR